jgi:hypothetical protein
MDRNDQTLPDVPEPRDFATLARFFVAKRLSEEVISQAHASSPNYHCAGA